ncbi:MAG: protein-methionine-sulfoxide reductase heme-binding subunit MsrQ [Gammaproteobacteria bacterium]
MRQPLSLWLKTRYRRVWWCLFLAALIPFANILFRYQTDRLGINPLQALQQETGQWALIFLIISLTVTPVRRFMAFICQKLAARYGKRISDWNWIIRLRRMLGLYALFYATLHCLTWLHFDISWMFSWIIEETAEKPYLVAGFLVYIILLILGLTSPRFMMKRLGKNWLRIHRSIYAASLLALLHVWWSAKPGSQEPLYYTFLIILLLLFRILTWSGILSRKPGDNGLPVPERQVNH